MQLDELYYAGSHGFEIVGPNDFQYQVPAQRPPDAAREALHNNSDINLLETGFSKNFLTDFLDLTASETFILIFICHFY